MDNNSVYKYKKAIEIAKDKRFDDNMCRKIKELNGKSAEEILKLSNQNTPPINLDEILSILDVKKYSASFEDLEKLENCPISGLVLLHKDDIGIFYKANDSIEKKRFTIAHELGHCCMHGEKLKNGYIEYLYGNRQNNSEDEEAASFFAKRLLIPENLLKDIHAKLRKPSLKGLADIFEVPIDVMKERLVELKMTYYLESEDKLVEPKL